MRARQWRSISLIPALRRQRQADLCEFEVSLVYGVSSRTAGATQRNPVLKKIKNKFKKCDGIRSPAESLQDKELEWLATGDG